MIRLLPKTSGLLPSHKLSLSRNHITLQNNFLLKNLKHHKSIITKETDQR